MDMPKPSPAHLKLHTLAGIWQGKETMHPSQWDPKGGVADGETRGRVATAGFAVVTDYRQTKNGVCVFEGLGVYTFDAEASEVVLHWFDSTGQGREEFRGGWQGSVLTLTSKGPMGHMRLVGDYGKPGVLKSSMALSPDGVAWSTMFDGVYHRKD